MSLPCNEQNVFTKTRKEPKPAKTTRNQPKRTKKIAKCPKTTKNFKINEIWNFLLTLVFQTSGPNAQIWLFWAKKYQLSNLSTKFCMYPISNELISNLTLVFENFESKSPNMGTLRQKV